MDFDLMVIGGGSGGVRAARIAASLGAKVAICEERHWGGTCVNVGCVPKKLMVYASACSTQFARSADFGWSGDAPTHDWSTLKTRRDAEVGRLNGIYAKMLGGAGVSVMEGRGEVVGPQRVRVGEREFSAKNIVLATGGQPAVPDIPGHELGINSDQLFALTERPQRLGVVGAGYIGVEFASVFNGLGSEVRLFCRGPQLLRGFDGEIREHLCGELVKAGVHIERNAPVLSLERSEGGVVICTPDRRVEVDVVLFATGRKPNSAGLGLEALGIELATNGAVCVDDRWRTAVPSVFAIGDLIDRVALTPVALEEGMQLAKNLFGGEDRAISYENIPTAIFTQPPVGTVGLSEEAAVAAGHRVTVFTSSFRPMQYTLGPAQTRALMKLVVDADSDRVLGCHMVGPSAGEIVQGLGVALNCGATKADFDRTIGVHPTGAEEFVTLRSPRADG